MKPRLLILTALAVSAQTRPDKDGPQFAGDGQLTLPKDYRQWVVLSSGLGTTYGPAASADPNNPLFDNVFVNPSSYRAFIETGRWSDKTMFVLEIRTAVGQGSINNAGHDQDELHAIEAEVKDEKHFPQKWAYFAFGGKDAATALSRDSTCNTCRGQNAAVENTFVQPVLLGLQKRNKLSTPRSCGSPPTPRRLPDNASIGCMALADIGRAITGQALDTAKNSMLDAVMGEPPKKTAAPAAPPPGPENIGSVMLGQIQAMQKSLKEDQELVVQFRSGEEMLRIVEIFIPSPQVFVLSGNDGQHRLTRIVTPAANVQLICKVLRVAPGSTPVRLRIMTPNPRPTAEVSQK